MAKKGEEHFTDVNMPKVSGYISI